MEVFGQKNVYSIGRGRSANMKGPKVELKRGDGFQVKINMSGLVEGEKVCDLKEGFKENFKVGVY